MTYNELIYEVGLLAGSPITDSELLLKSCNRALRTLYNNAKITKTARLATHGLKPVSYYREIKCINGEELVFPARGVAYSMRVHGNGRILITDGDIAIVERVDSPHESTVVKGFLTSGGTITFWGSMSFNIYDFSIYDQVFSEKKENIPEYGPTVTLDLREILGDFMTFVSPALDPEGNPLDNCRLHDGKLEIDSDYCGEIMLTYRRMPREILEDDDDVTVDLPEEYAHLLPLLVAHYAMLNIDESRAKYYKSLYNEGIELIRRESYGDLDCKYPVTNGWA